MKAIAQHFFGTTEEWNKAGDPVLYKAVLGFEQTKDENILAKLGDGKTPWSRLGYYDLKRLSELPKDFQEVKKLVDIIDSGYHEAIDKETQARGEADYLLQEAIIDEGKVRLEADSQLQEMIGEEQKQRNQQITDGFAGVHFATLDGVFLSRAINGTTEVPKHLFEIGTVFTAGKTIISDTHGTTGVCIKDLDSANIIVETKSTSQIGSTDTTNLGVLERHAELPLTVTNAIIIFGRTPVIDNYATIRRDETKNNYRVEWYITAIDDDSNITWGNEVVIDDRVYQEQTSAAMSGKVLLGGDTPGTHNFKDIDTVPTANSANLITSGGVRAAINALPASPLSVGEAYVRNNLFYIELPTLSFLRRGQMGIYFLQPLGGNSVNGIEIENSNEAATYRIFFRGADNTIRSASNFTLQPFEIKSIPSGIGTDLVILIRTA